VVFFGADCFVVVAGDDGWDEWFSGCCGNFVVLSIEVFSSC